MIEIFLNASVVIKFVLFALVGLSIGSWGIILYKYLQLAAVDRESLAVFEALQACRSSRDLGSVLAAAEPHDAGPMARMVKFALGKDRHGSKEEVRGHLRSVQAQELDRLESYLIFLATTGSTAPFIGLFGTVWGIMDAFHRIGAAGSASLAVVAPGIAEALVATAVGLAAAIPAVMAYNFFINWVRRLSTLTEAFVESLQGFLTGHVS